jgi:DNA-3-methyladenine glycosylase I
VAEPVRCQWSVQHPELIPYHDEVWGRPQHDDQEIFAAYAQCVLHAGLVWTAMLKKRDVFRWAFDEWDIAKVAAYDGAEVDRLLHTEGMIRNFQKINAVIHNAGRFLVVQQEFGSFDAYVWQFNDKDELSADLKRRGFKFAGPATAYGLMEDIGIVNDHDHGCFLGPAQA